MLRLVLFGAHGQLGSELVANSNDKSWELISAPRELRLEDNEGVSAFLKACQPDWVINAAAMTDVDAAHRNPGQAVLINGLAVGSLAQIASELAARVIHVSSEAVYGGSKLSPYTEDDVCFPVSVYGVSKLMGDLLSLTYNSNTFVLRTSWLYSRQLGRNFPTRILRQLAEQDQPVPVVTDIVGNPTSTGVLREAIEALVAQPPGPGLYNVSTRGAVSKYDWAVEIAKANGHDVSRIVKATADMYTTVAQRPKYVDLDCSKFSATGTYDLPTWRDAWLKSLTGK